MKVSYPYNQYEKSAHTISLIFTGVEYKSQQALSHIFPHAFAQTAVYCFSFHTKVAVTKSYFSNCITISIYRNYIKLALQGLSVLPTCYSLYTVMEKHTHAITTICSVLLLATSGFNSRFVFCRMFPFQMFNISNNFILKNITSRLGIDTQYI